MKPRAISEGQCRMFRFVCRINHGLREIFHNFRFIVVVLFWMGLSEGHVFNVMQLLIRGPESTLTHPTFYISYGVCKAFIRLKSCFENRGIVLLFCFLVPLPLLLRLAFGESDSMSLTSSTCWRFIISCCIRRIVFLSQRSFSMSLSWCLPQFSTGLRPNLSHDCFNQETPATLWHVTAYHPLNRHRCLLCLEQ